MANGDFTQRLQGMGTNPLLQLGLGIMGAGGRIGPGLQAGMGNLQQAQAAQQQQQMAAQQQQLKQLKFMEEMKKQQQMERYKTEAMAGLSPEERSAALAFPEVGQKIFAQKFKKPEEMKLPSGMMMGPGGQPQWIPGYLEGRARVSKAGAPGLTVQLPGRQPLEKPVRKKVQESEIEARSQMKRIDNIFETFDPGELTYGSAVEDKINRVLEKVNPDLVSQSGKEKMAKRAIMQQDILTNINNTIKEITGAAMGVEEADRIMSTLPTMDDSESQATAKLKRAKEVTKDIIREKREYQVQGLPPVEEDPFQEYGISPTQITQPTGATQPTMSDADIFKQYGL